MSEGWTRDLNTFWKEKGGEKWPVAGATAKNSLEGASSRRVLVRPELVSWGQHMGFTASRLAENQCDGGKSSPL